MAFSFPSLRKPSPRTVLILAAVGALAVGAVAAGASKDQAAPSNEAPAAAPPPKQVPAVQATTDSARTSADTQAAAALPQCRAARLVTINSTWGIPVPSVYGSTSTNCNLMYGDDPHRGSTVYGDPDTAIRVLQRNLNYCYGSKLTVDGIYGSNTRAVVKLVQQRHKLAVDGIYGPKTRSAMNWRMYSMATRSWSTGCYSPI
jgi:hypothetical protein